MKAKLQKLSANKDSKDSIQFQIREEEVENCRDEIMDLRRYDYVTVKYEAKQSTMGVEVELDDSQKYNLKTFFPTLKFQSINTSISLCVTEKGIIATLTFSFDDPKVFDHVINNKLRNQFVTLKFEEGANPFTAK